MKHKNLRLAHWPKHQAAKMRRIFREIDRRMAARANIRGRRAA